MHRLRTQSDLISARVSGGSGARSGARRGGSILRLAVVLTIAGAILQATEGRVQAQSGIISTVVGHELNGPGLQSAYLETPTGVAVDTTSSALPTIYTADVDDCVVWKTQGGQTTTFAGMNSSGGLCSGGAVNASPTATPLDYPVAVATCSGNVYIAVHGTDPSLMGGTAIGGAVYVVSAAGVLTALPQPTLPASAGPLYPVAVTCDAQGNVYLSGYYYAALMEAQVYGEVVEYSPDGAGGWTINPLISASYLQAYPAIAIDPVDNDLYGFSITFAVGWVGQPSTTDEASHIVNLTQGGGQALGNSVDFDNPSGLAVDANGDFIVAEGVGVGSVSTVVELVAHSGANIGTKTVIAGTGSQGQGQDGIPAIQSALGGVSQLVIDPTGSVYLADTGTGRVREFHLLATGPTALTLASTSVPQSSTHGFQQAGFDASTGDFYYVSGSNLVNVVNTGASVLSPGVERIIATIPVGAAGTGGSSSLTLIVDSFHHLVYVNNATDGNLYVIDGSASSATSLTVLGSVALNNPAAYLLALDPGLNEIYVAGPTASSVSAVRGGGSPVLIGNVSVLPTPVISITVDTAVHTVYAVSNTGAGTGQEEGFLSLTPDPTTGALTLVTTTFPVNETVLYPDFIANSIAMDTLTGNLIVSGAASPDPQFNQTEYESYDIYQVTPTTVLSQAYFTFAPLTTALDPGNSTFYTTDFDGLVSDPASHAAMVNGTDSQLQNPVSMVVTPIPVFGTGALPPSPHVFDLEADTSSYQAWLSGSDATDGGFVKLWDGQTQALTSAVGIPNNGGGYLTVDSTNHAAYLLDQVNGLLWLINKPPWTTVPQPVTGLSKDGQSVTMTAANAVDAVYYTTNGTPPGANSTACGTSGAAVCKINLVQGQFTVINSIEVSGSGSAATASNVEQQVFTAAAPSSIALVLNPVSTSTGASAIATATITPASGVASVTGTVAFTAQIAGSSAVTLCASVSVALSGTTYQAVCSYTVPSTPGAYVVTASYSGDASNQASSGTASLVVVQGVSPPTLGTISGPTSVVAISQNNSPGLGYNAYLNADSSVGLLQNGAVISGEGCPAYSQLTTNQGTLSGGAIYVDVTNSRIYLAMLESGQLYAAYEAIDAQGNCTQGPLLQVATPGFSTIEMNVDPVQGNMYILDATGGGNLDSLYIIPTAPWSATALPTPAALTMDYSVVYGPILIDPSNHQVYINDLGASTYGFPGTYTTSGFFVYDPTQSMVPANNLQHVVGYVSGASTVAINASWILTNGAGKLTIVNENPTTSTASLGVPLTILDTTKFSFFQNTQKANTYSSQVDISPGGGLSTISAATQYGAISAADIDAVNGLVYAYGYGLSSSTIQAGSGLLLQYNLSSGTEKVIASSVTLPTLYNTVAPWGMLNYDAFSSELILSSETDGSGALGATTPVCAGTPLTLTQILGSAGGATPIGTPTVNAISGYMYVIDSSAIAYLAPPASGCMGAPTLIATTTTLTAPATATSGQPISITVSVTPASGAVSSVTGTATVTDTFTPTGMTTTQTSTFPGLTVNASASITLNGAGVHSLTASYSGDSTHSASIAGAAVQVSIAASSGEQLAVLEDVTVTDDVVISVLAPSTVSDAEIIDVNDVYSISVQSKGMLSPTPTPVVEVQIGPLKDVGKISLSDSNTAAAIYYTLDGSMPHTTAGGSTLLYSTPFPITDVTSVLSVIALATGDSPSAVVTIGGSTTVVSINPQLSALIVPTIGTGSEMFTLASGSSSAGSSIVGLQGMGPRESSGTASAAFSFTVSGLPENADASFNPAMVTLSGNSVSTTLTVTTGVAPAGTVATTTARWSHYGLPVVALMLFLGGAGLRRRPRSLPGIVLLAVVGLAPLALTLTSCGASPSKYRTPPGTYVLVVTATSQQPNVTVTVSENIELLVR
jgi:hypothetical protein